MYLVATPIGNLEDISLRALRILKEVGLIAAEDTRRTHQLLSRYQISTPLTSYYEHNKLVKLPAILRRLEQEDVALVSEAGMPGISDPGYELVAAAIEHGFTVVPIPGASALTAALAVSGLPASQFVFLGFLPRRKAERRRLLQSVSAETRTLVAFETPHRLRAALADILEMLGDRQVAICRELTKIYEEVFRGAIKAALEHFAVPRGEFTLVIEGNKDKEQPASNEIEEELRKLKKAGTPFKEAFTRLTAQSRLSKRKAYQIWLRLG